MGMCSSADLTEALVCLLPAPAACLHSLLQAAHLQRCGASLLLSCKGFASGQWLLCLPVNALQVSLLQNSSSLEAALAKNASIYNTGELDISHLWNVSLI